ncbi:AraC family transcriptional regulator [Rhodococcus sp. PAMC28707]|uniref:aquaporin n=1 Tax=unclassified Rhodococcus (in: high G+C Gram-positive bacteria) TaxID=192944 RepID=UPI00109DBEBF|nr:MULTISPECIES: aquaporin [unclassified Rhodococcus (in: high G+C Gram-positive bacteria)]QCB51656.1 AraC family transcriptional regulator [Rhodococcus sp. PAMC28705]QCB60176.1 AraC family transcriptional regulator [Rhodococcus sp. PAMC28707]
MSTAQEYAEPEVISDTKKYVAEAIGTFVLVFTAVGTAVFAGDKVGNLGVALAFGLTLLFLVYAIGPISGCHVNPAVTMGQLLLGRLSIAKAGFYVLSQVIGGLIAGATLFAVANSLPSYDRKMDGLGANGWGAHSPSAIKGPLGGVLENGYGIGAAIVIEVLLTALLVFVVLASTDQISDVPLAGVSIGFTLTVIHLVAIPIDNTSVNPARSLAVAVWQPGALSQVWLFIVFPLVGGALGALIYRGVFGRYNRLDS